MHCVNGQCKPLIPGSTQSSQLCDLQREFIRLQLIDSIFANFSGRQFWWKRYVTLRPRGAAPSPDIGSRAHSSASSALRAGAALFTATDRREPHPACPALAIAKGGIHLLLAVRVRLVIGQHHVRVVIQQVADQVAELLSVAARE